LPELKANGKSVAILYLEYTLVPHATYPTQIEQAIEAVNYVKNDLQRSASRIILAGDSAGGNMCLAVLSQAMHPTSDLPKVELDKPFKSLLLVAPWVSFDMTFPSAKRNAYKDIVSSYAGGLWSSDYLAGKATSQYAEALSADPSWWKNPQVEHIVCVAGADELLVDPINAWVEKYKVRTRVMTPTRY
jgi:acetyl esterase/lipase